MKQFYVLIKSGCHIVQEVEDEYLKVKYTGDDIYIGDEYHTLDELYNHRMALNIALFNTWYYEQINEEPVTVMKSKFHNDGTMFEGGYFIVMAITAEGQISYHYKLEHWDKFQIPEVKRTPPYDGHTSKDVIERLSKL